MTLRPRVYRQRIDRFTRRFMFALEHPNGTRRFLASADVFDRTYGDYPFRTRGISFDVRLFDH